MQVSVSIILYYFTFCQNSTYGYIFSIQMIDVIASMIDISWLYQGMEDFKKIVARNTLVKICGLIIIFVFVKSRADLPIYVLSYSATLFLGNLSMWLYLPKFVKKINFNQLNIQQHLRPTIILFLPQIATSIYTMLDKTMIGALTNNTAEVGFYEQSQKIIRMAMTIATSLGTVMLPRVANLFKEGKIEEVKESMYTSFQFISFLTLPLCFGLIGISKGFVPWFFGDGYWKVVYNMMIISPIIIIIGYSNVIGTQFLLPTGRQKEYTLSVCTGTVVNLCCNFLLIPGLLSYGAAIATVIAELSVTIVQIIATRKTFSFKYVFKLVYKYIIAAVLMLIVLLVLNETMPVGIIYTVIQMVIGGLIYFIVLIILKDSSMFTMINKIKRR